MLHQEQFSRMTLISLAAAFLAAFYLPAGFLAVVTGFAALDEIRRYHYKGKVLSIVAIVLGSGFFLMHIVLINIYHTNIIDSIKKLFPDAN